MQGMDPSQAEPGTRWDDIVLCVHAAPACKHETLEDDCPVCWKTLAVELIGHLTMSRAMRHAEMLTGQPINWQAFCPGRKPWENAVNCTCSGAYYHGKCNCIEMGLAKR